MKIVDGLLQMVLETGTKKEVLVYLKSLNYVPLKGIVTAVDPNMGWILIESGDKPDQICFLIKSDEILYMSYLKCNGVDNNGSKVQTKIKK